MKNLVLVILVFISPFILLAQQKEIKRPQASFENGIGITHPDSLYSLNFRFRMQTRAGFTTVDGDDLAVEETEMRIRRMRLRFEGFMLNPRLTYYIQLSVSRGDMDWSDKDASVYNTSPNIVRDAIVNYRFSPKFTLGLGQTKLPGNRQRVVSSGEQQFVDRALTNARYTIDRDFGFFGTYKDKIGSVVYLLKGAVTSGEGRNSDKSDNGLAYTGRVELLPFGAFTNKGDYSEGDLEREKTPKLSIAGGYSYNVKARRTQGTIGKDLYEARDIGSLIIDAVFKYQGFALSTEYLTRTATDPITYNNDKSKLSAVVVGRGQLYQGSYIFLNNIELAARYAVSTPNKDVYGINEKEENYTVCTTKYLRKHRVKLQMDLTYGNFTNMETKAARDSWNPRLQIELGI